MISISASLGLYRFIISTAAGLILVIHFLYNYELILSSISDWISQVHSSSEVDMVKSTGCNYIEKTETSKNKISKINDALQSYPNLDSVIGRVTKYLIVFTIFSLFVGEIIAILGEQLLHSIFRKRHQGEYIICLYTRFDPEYKSSSYPINKLTQILREDNPRSHSSELYYSFGRVFSGAAIYFFSISLLEIALSNVDKKESLIFLVAWLPIILLFFIFICIPLIQLSKSIFSSNSLFGRIKDKILNFIFIKLNFTMDHIQWRFLISYILFLLFSMLFLVFPHFFISERKISIEFFSLLNIILCFTLIFQSPNFLTQGKNYFFIGLIIVMFLNFISVNLLYNKNIVAKMAMINYLMYGISIVLSLKLTSVANEINYELLTHQSIILKIK